MNLLAGAFFYFNNKKHPTQLISCRIELFQYELLSIYVRLAHVKIFLGLAQNSI